MHWNHNMAAVPMTFEEWVKAKRYMLEDFIRPTYARKLVAKDAFEAGRAAGIEQAVNVAIDYTPGKNNGGTLAAHCAGISIQNGIRALLPSTDSEGK